MTSEQRVSLGKARLLVRGQIGNYEPMLPIGPFSRPGGSHDKPQISLSGSLAALNAFLPSCPLEPSFVVRHDVPS